MIAGPKVRYVGEPVAVVLADSAAVAEDALDLVAVEIDPLPPVTDRARRRATSRCSSRRGRQSRDGIARAAAMRRRVQGCALYTRRERFSVHRHTAVTMEPRGVLAEWDACAII